MIRTICDRCDLDITGDDHRWTLMLQETKQADSKLPYHDLEHLCEKCANIISAVVLAGRGGK